MPVYQVQLTWTEERLRVVEVEADSAEAAESAAISMDFAGCFDGEHEEVIGAENVEAEAELKRMDSVCPFCKNPNGNMLLGRLADAIHMRCRDCGGTYRTE